MKFSNIETCDNRQRVNLSGFALSVLASDMHIFSSDTKNESDGNLIGFINTIINNYSDSADSTIVRRLSECRHYYRDSLSAFKISDGIADNIVSALLSKNEHDLKARINVLLSDKGSSVNLRIRAGNMAILSSEELRENGTQYYQDNVGLYIKAVLEEYVRLSYPERERIYFKSIIDTVGIAKNNGSMLRIILFNRTADKTTRIREFRPFDVLCDTGQSYNYLAGYVFKDDDKCWVPHALRLTSIKECHESAIKTGGLTPQEKHQLSHLIQKNGVQYLSSVKTDKVVVQLTPNGERLYRKIISQRPFYIAKTPQGVYTFDCTLNQAEIYFFRFGADAKILEPTSLAEKFKIRYGDALKQYGAE